MNTINIPNDEKFRIRDSVLLHYIGNEDIVFVRTDGFVTKDEAECYGTEYSANNRHEE